MIFGLALAARRQAVQAALEVLSHFDDVAGEFLHGEKARILHLPLGPGAEIGHLRLGPHPTFAHLVALGSQAPPGGP